MVRLTAQPSAPSPAAPGSPPTAQAAQQRWDQLSQALSPDGVDAPSTSAANGSALVSAKLGAQDDVIQCPDCTKPILESAMPDHAVNCQKIRERSAAGGTQMKRRLSSTSTDSPSKKPRPTSLVLVLGEGGTGSSSEEAPLSSTAGPGNKKKLVIKDGGERKPRATGPVDLDRQCGVPVPNPLVPGTTQPCSRSLTCKSHSLTLKRQVPHRSRPFDVLLAEWQRLNKAAPAAPVAAPGTRGSSGALEATTSATQLGGQTEADTEKGRKKEKKRKRLAAQQASLAAQQAAAGAGGGAGGADLLSLADQRRGKKGLQIVGEWSDDELLPEGEDNLIDSEEEVESVLRGLSRSQFSLAGAGTSSWGRPLAGVTHGGGAGFSGASLFVGRNVKLARLREALGGLFGSLS